VSKVGERLINAAREGREAVGKEQTNLFDELDCPILHKSYRGREILAALEKLGDRAHLRDIKREVAKARRARGERVPKELGPSIRNGLQRHCSQAKQYGGHSDWFRSCGNGIWELASKKK
jgi:hypothetical protein